MVLFSARNEVMPMALFKPMSQQGALTSARKFVDSNERTRAASIPNLNQETQLRKWDNACAYCDVSFDERPLHWDHVMPLFLNGANDGANVVPSCDRCNLAKGAKHPMVWLKDKKPRHPIAWVHASTKHLSSLPRRYRKMLRKDLTKHLRWLRSDGAKSRRLVMTRRRFYTKKWFSAQNKRDRVEVQRMLRILNASLKS